MLGAPPPPPEVTVLILGEQEVGKSTFMSYVSGISLSSQYTLINICTRRLTLGAHPQSDDLPPYSLPVLRDMDQPYTFHVSLYNRPYTLLFYDTASPTNYTLLRPDFIILAYDISRRDTLQALRGYWRELVNTHFNYDETLPVMVLGLKRDLRKEWTEEEKKDEGRGESVMPQEGLLVAQEMLCDRYAECSAITGELCREVLEDVARTAARTTTENGAKTQGPACVVM